MLLAIDIGNTNITLGAFEADQISQTMRLSTPHALTVDEAVMPLERFIGFNGGEIARTVLASVVPRLSSVYADAVRRLASHDPLIVSPEIKLPVRIEIDRPEQLGADRIANAVAGFLMYGGPAVVVDFGTATTFDVISSSGAYVGGVIIPGPQTAMTDLARRAARLFQVPIEPPERVIGRSTEQALQAGFFFGTVGQVDYIIEKIISESGETGHHIIATGGLAGRIEMHSRFIQEVEPDLTLHGLRLISAST